MPTALWIIIIRNERAEKGNNEPGYGSSTGSRFFVISFLQDRVRTFILLCLNETGDLLQFTQRHRDRKGRRIS